MIEIAIQSPAGAAQGAELVSVLTQYASDFFDEYTYNGVDEAIMCKNTGDSTNWVTFRISTSTPLRTTFFDGSYASASNITNGINCVYVGNNFVALCNKRAQGSVFYLACCFAKNTLGEVCCFYESTYSVQTSMQSMTNTSQELYSSPAVLYLINTTSRGLTKIPVGDMNSQTQIVNAIPIYDTKDTMLDGVYYNTMGALKNVFELTEFMHNGHMYTSVLCGRLIVDES